MILENAVEARKPRQRLDAPSNYLSFLRPTALSRMMRFYVMLMCLLLGSEGVGMFDLSSWGNITGNLDLTDAVSDATHIGT